ncbi:hypothetical protein ASC97_32205 [Rhizobium sp. Root1203]|uniref:hypothetical protein n=1 Tax=Rhizobium sp. Root1203 TaxID=1736427 RepID=UPI00070F36F3|nr:hypothetical protein [Rhizobium sp. Root1203]KQV12687.1 hypothetical protein ASC97_32205 [Rhizobium sp. Root1203]
MKWRNSDEPKNSLEVTTYANSLRIALRRCGIFLKGDKAVGLVLPPDADIDTYQQAVKAVLVSGGIARADRRSWESGMPDRGKNGGGKAVDLDQPKQLEVSIETFGEALSKAGFSSAKAGRKIVGQGTRRETLKKETSKPANK